MGNALDRALPSGALEGAHALRTLVGAEEGCDRLPIETDLAGDFGQDVLGPDIAALGEIPF